MTETRKGAKDENLKTEKKEFETFGQKKIWNVKNLKVKTQFLLDY